MNHHIRRKFPLLMVQKGFFLGPLICIRSRTLPHTRSASRPLFSVEDSFSYFCRMVSTGACTGHRLLMLKTTVPFKKHHMYSMHLHCAFRPKQQRRATATDAVPNYKDNNIKKERIKQQFDGRAATYDNDNSYHPSLAKHLLQMCDLQPGQRLLDLGAGTGMVAVPAAAAVAPEGRVVALDLSEAMLAQAKAKAEAQQLEGIMEFVVGDMEHLDKYLSGQQGLFDAITCSAAVPFLQDPFIAIDSWKYWLAPGGKLAFNAFTPPAIEEFGTFMRLAAQHGFPEVVDPCEALGSVELATQAMQAAGYVGIEVTAEQKTRLMPATTPEEHAENIWRMAVNFSLPDGVLQTMELSRLHDTYMLAAVEELNSKGRFDAEKKHVLNRYTVLHVLGSGPEQMSN